MHPYIENIKKLGASANNTFVTLGIEPVSYGGGEAVLQMKVSEKLQNGAGMLQGGFYTVLGDEAIALAIHAELEDGQNAVTISETTEFLKGVSEGTVVSRAKIIRKGRKVIFAEAEVHETSLEGKLLSRTSASYLVI